MALGHVEDTDYRFWAYTGPLSSSVANSNGLEASPDCAIFLVPRWDAHSTLTHEERDYANMTSLMEVYDRLFEAFGPQQWWPGRTPLEVMVGAVLVQNTAWANVERAIDNLREEGLLSLEALHTLRPEDLAETIRPAGYYRLKAGRLRNLIDFVFERYDGSIEAMRVTDPTQLRSELLEVRGIGQETADSILLYALNTPTFVVDTYTHRVLARHGWIDYDADYHRIKEHFESELPTDVSLYNEYHALLVRVGKDFCRKTSPKCELCPLYSLLPESGIVEPL